MIPLHDRYAKPALKMVDGIGIEPIPQDFQSSVHTKYTTHPKTFRNAPARTATASRGKSLGYVRLKWHVCWLSLSRRQERQIAEHLKRTFSSVSIP